MYELSVRISEKPSLRHFYERTYARYQECLQRCPKNGLVVEIGSGAGFAKSFIPDIITSDILPYDGVDKVVDATKLPLENESVRLLCMLNVFHHIREVEKFLREAQRCLIQGGRVLIVDQHVGLLSRPILKYFHHEPFEPNAENWRFESTGALSGANGALAWIVFVRDRQEFCAKFPDLRLFRYDPHTPFSYWLTGGLKAWNLLPRWSIRVMDTIDDVTARLFPTLGSFVDIELVKR